MSRTLRKPRWWRGRSLVIGAPFLWMALFFLAPLFLTKLVNTYLPNSVVFNIVEGVIRLGVFIAYLKVMSLLPDIKRVFTYHGAEHKTVNAYEAGVAMEVDAIRSYSTAHVRCGTSFLFTVLVIAIALALAWLEVADKPRAKSRNLGAWMRQPGLS